MGKKKTTLDYLNSSLEMAEKKVTREVRKASWTKKSVPSKSIHKKQKKKILEFSGKPKLKDSEANISGL